MLLAGYDGPGTKLKRLQVSAQYPPTSDEIPVAEESLRSICGYPVHAPQLDML